jgi:hypothetical protein
MTYRDHLRISHPDLGRARDQRLDDRGRHQAAAVGLQRPEGQSRHPGRLGGLVVVERSLKQIGIEHFGAHDLRQIVPEERRGSGAVDPDHRTLSGMGRGNEIAVNDNLGL